MNSRTQNYFLDMRSWRCVHILQIFIGKYKNPNKKGVSEHIAISWISGISMAKKRPCYAIKWTHLQNSSTKPQSTWLCPIRPVWQQVLKMHNVLLNTLFMDSQGNIFFVNCFKTIWIYNHEYYIMISYC